MCGIAGYATLGTNHRVDASLLNKMTTTLMHRGPDDMGTVVYPQVGLGNTRLSIIGLEDGHQPIYNEDGSVVVVFNGEIYNYPALAKGLRDKGHVFETKTDTEVLVHLYEEYGIDFIKQLNGMFTFALYDRAKGEVYVGRDRFGVKPLVYTQLNGCLFFASEIKALKCVPEFNSDIDPEAISVYLGLFFIPDPWTIYRHVRKLRPGHYLKFTREGLSDHEYYDLDYSHKIDISSQDAQSRIADLFRQSVHRQLLSDVPVGVLLSGGMDSRSVLASASEKNPGTHSFTITFTEADYNEGDEAGHWASLFESPHQTLRVTDEQFCQHLLERQKHLDEPYGIWCNVAIAQMARFIRNNNYKVVLSGEGGDELLCGYPTLHAANVARYYRVIPEFIRRKIITPIVRKLPARAERLPLSFKLKSFVEADHANPYRNFHGFKEIVRYKTWEQLLTPEAMASAGKHDPFAVYQQYLPKIEKWNLIDALSYLDFKGILPACLFFGNDNAFMSASVELRVPFMDNDLVDFSTSLPVSVRFHPFKTKDILRKAFMKLNPALAGKTTKCLKGYSKKGFEVPANVWLHDGRFKKLLSEILSRERVKKTGFFNPDVVDRLLQEQISLKQNNERILQAITSLVLFLDGKYEL